MGVLRKCEKCREDFNVPELVSKRMEKYLCRECRKNPDAPPPPPEPEDIESGV